MNFYFQGVEVNFEHKRDPTGEGRGGGGVTNEC